MATLPRIIRLGLAAGIKLLMVASLLACLIGVPLFVIASSWSLLASLYHEHPFWFLLLVLPALYVAARLIKWMYQVLGATMMAIGGVVDRLERGNDSP